jgi:excisionase family DNA binding protein
MGLRKTPKNVASIHTESQIEPLAVTIPQACRLTGLARSSIYREIGAGRIRIAKAGKRTLVPLASLRAWLASLPQSA